MQYLINAVLHLFYPRPTTKTAVLRIHSHCGHKHNAVGTQTKTHTVSHMTNDESDTCGYREERMVLAAAQGVIFVAQ